VKSLPEAAYLEFYPRGSGDGLRRGWPRFGRPKGGFPTRGARRDV